MRSVLATTLLLVGLTAGVALPPAGSGSPAVAELGEELGRLLGEPRWRPEQWGVLVVSLETGDTLYAHRAHEVLAPASNLKLFTSAAGLHYLGPDYRYSTYLVATGPIRDGVLDGDLVVYGTGDPTFSRRFFDTNFSVWESLADSLAEAGVRRVTGDLVGDASHFQGPAVGQGWDLSYVSHMYAAPASALSYNDNVVSIRVRPGPSVGATPTLLLVPGGTMEIEVATATVASGRSWIEVERESYDAPIRLIGQIQRGHAGLWRGTPVVDPAHFAVSVFAAVLESRGIEVDGTVRSVHDAGASSVASRRVFAPALDGAPVVQVLAVHRSPPLLELLKVVNQRSHNLYAESVLRSVGRVATGHGSVEGGAAALARMLDAAGTPPESVVMDDGSGLSRLNGASARALVDVLGLMAASPHWEAFQETLPEAATSSGLRRMHRTEAAGNLRAKTGTIDRVSALSGYVHARNGERLAFAILANGVSPAAAKRVEDRIGARLAEFDR
jgi:serine-type D-Ala-D-Ala carboxypeptidase/endopeptidase (penicillin-binding protein 4)